MVDKLLAVVILKKLFKGSLTRDFCLQVSYPLDPEYPIGAISNFYKNSRNSQLCVVDTVIKPCFEFSSILRHWRLIYCW
jgi:hypothetical protein